MLKGDVVMNKIENDLITAWSEVGKHWSRTGRGVAKAALENIAEVLKKTAKAIDVPEETGTRGSEATSERPPAQRVDASSTTGAPIQPPNNPPPIG
jgi:hypothetical protein